jgi:L-iditol 2-dehydrogenase
MRREQFMKTMKAAVLSKPYKIGIKNVPIPQIGENEVLIKVEACGICGSDVHAYEGNHFMVTYPRVLGHEFAGIIVETGPKVKDLKAGDRVCAETNIPCGECYLCKNGNARLCKNKLVNGFNLDGGLAQYAKIPEQNAVLLPANVTTEDAALAQPIGVGYHAIMDRTQLKSGNYIAVFGAGAIGLGVMVVAKSVGAKVIMIDLLDHKLQVSLVMGADYIVCPGEEDLQQRVMEITNGVGVDYVFECVGGGQSTTIQQAVDIVKCSGSIVVVGTFAHKEMAVNINGIRAKEIDLKGSHGQYGTYEHCIDLVGNGKANVRPMYTHELRLKDIEVGIKMIKEHKDGIIKALIKPWK